MNLLHEYKLTIKYNGLSYKGYRRYAVRFLGLRNTIYFSPSQHDLFHTADITREVARLALKDFGIDGDALIPTDSYYVYKVRLLKGAYNAAHPNRKSRANRNKINTTSNTSNTSNNYQLI